MDYFNNVLTIFLGLERSSCDAVHAGQKALKFLQIYLNLCFEDEQRSYGFGRTHSKNDFTILFTLFKQIILI